MSIIFRNIIFPPGYNVIPLNIGRCCCFTESCFTETYSQKVNGWSWSRMSFSYNFLCVVLISGQESFLLFLYVFGHHCVFSFTLKLTFLCLSEWRCWGTDTQSSLCMFPIDLQRCDCKSCLPTFCLLPFSPALEDKQNYSKRHRKHLGFPSYQSPTGQHI